MNESFEDWLRRRRVERMERRNAGKLSARTLTTVVFVLTALYCVWALARPNPPAVSILAQFWTGVSIFCPFIAIILTGILLFGYIRSDSSCEIWAYAAALLTVSMVVYFFVRPHASPPPGWVNP